MKSPFLAFTLSFLLPGAGLAYLGKWKWAAVNLAAALIIGIVAGFLLPDYILDAYGRYVAIGIGCGSGAWAQGTAQQMNAEAKNVPTMDELSDQARID